MKHVAIALLVVGLTAGCVEISEIGTATGPSDSRSSTIVSGAFPGLDAGAAHAQTLHFQATGYGINETQRAADQAEGCYNRIMIDTNLFSFQPNGQYHIVIYGSPDEYHRKTGQPSWSGGVTVGNSIYTFAGPTQDLTVAHEMTHLIFYEFMGSGRVTSDNRWVNEGLAVYEEAKTAQLEGYRGDLFASVRESLRVQPIPMDQMIKLIPATERERTVNLWYAEAEGLIHFMIDRGGRIGFSQFLTALRDGRSFDDAIAPSFTGVWRGLDDFALSWQKSL
jgi:hypothetical protein